VSSKTPITYRPDAQAAKAIEDAERLLGWSQQKIVNESVLLAIPELIKQQAERLKEFTSTKVQRPR